MFELMALFFETIIGGAGNILSSLIRLVSNLSMLLITQLVIIIISINQRKNEYNADYFALKNGYGADLTEVLYILKKLDLGGKPSILERIKSDHPYIDDRIAKLEEKLDEYTINYVSDEPVNENYSLEEQVNESEQEIPEVFKVFVENLFNKPCDEIKDNDIETPQDILDRSINMINEIREKYGLDKKDDI